jgi:hypothetical protein
LRLKLLRKLFFKGLISKMMKNKEYSPLLSPAGQNGQDHSANISEGGLSYTQSDADNSHISERTHESEQHAIQRGFDERNG